MTANHEHRALVSALTTAPPVDPLRMLLGKVSARDPATKTCTVEVAGDTANPLPGVAPFAHYVPRVSDLVWLASYKTAWLAIGSPTAKTPSAQMRQGGIQTFTNGTVTPLTFSVLQWDTDGMANLTTERLTFNWPGVYSIGISNLSYASGTSGRRILDIRRNGVEFMCRFEVTTGSAGTLSTAGTINAAAADYIEACFTITGPGSLPSVAVSNTPTQFWASYLGPGP